jgi:hypothetical protein
MVQVPESKGHDVKFKTSMLMMLTALSSVIQPVWAGSIEEAQCLAQNKYPSEKETQPPAQEESFRHAFEVADCVRKAASSQGAEWLETEKLLHRSLELANTGDWEKALQLVQIAHFQAITALQQAEHEAEAWKNRVVK